MYDLLKRITSQMHSYEKEHSRTAFGIFAVLFVIVGVFSYNALVQAATYTFTQSSWTGGVDAVTVATHASNRTNWAKYNSASTTLSVGSSVTLATTAYGFTDDGATSTSPAMATYGGGFANGTSASTVSFTDDGTTSTNGTGTSGGGFANGTNSSTVMTGSGTGASVGLSPSGLLTPLSPATIATGSIAPYGITVSADGTSAYASNYNGTISQYSRNISTGLLTALSPATTTAGGADRDVIISADGTSVYTTNYTDYTISQFSRNTTTGLLTALSPATIATGVRPQYGAISADGKSVYVTNWTDGTISQYSRATGTGLLTALSPATVTTGTHPYGITVSADGKSIYTANNGSNTVSQYSRDTTSGLLTALSPATIATGVVPTGVKVSADGTSVYAANETDGTLSMYSRNITTGLLTALSPTTITTGTAPQTVLISSDGVSVYTTNYNNNTISQYIRNPSTGLLTALSPVTIAAPGSALAAAISADGKSVYVTNYSNSTISQYSRGTGATSGTFTSANIDLGATQALTTLSYTKTTPTNTALTVDVRASDNGSTWGSYLTSVASGGDISSLGSHRYVQYRANLSTTDTTVTPTLDSLTVNWSGSVANNITGSGTGASVALPLGGGVRQQAIAGGSDSGYTLKSDGTVWSWGYNSSGELGNNSTTQSNVPVQVSGLTGVTAIAGGWSSGYALKSDGTVWSWGRGSYGELGNNSTNQSNVPVQVSGLTGVTKISSGDVNGYALKSDGTVWAWGAGAQGNLGNNSTTQSNVPVQVSGLTGVTAISGGNSSGYAVKSDGTVWAWGENDYGELGNNSTTQSNVPVQVSGLTGVIAVDSGMDNGYALKSDGTVWAWGRGNYGELGNNSITQSNVPVQVSGLTGVITIAGGTNSGYALKSDGTVWAWGDNGSGELGNNSITQSNVPVQVSGLTGVTAIAGSCYSHQFAYALTSSGTVWSWGYNGYGQLGNNNTTNSSVPVQVSGLISSYAPSSTFTSAVINLGSPVALTTLSYTDTLNAQTITMDVRAGNTATPDGTWTAWTTNVASGGSITALGSKQYVQYRANLSTTNTTVTPTLDSVTIGYSQYATSGSLISSVYDTGDSHNLIARVTWVDAATTTADTVSFQVRSSPDGTTWSAYCGYADCSGTSYFTDSSGNGQDLANNHPLRIGNDDRYVQYRAFLASDGGATPSLTSISLKYVINAPPDFNAAYGTNGVIVSQDATSTEAAYGKVNISYSVRDTDSTTGTINPGFITPSFEYSTNGGSSWTAISSGALQASDVTNKAVDQSIYDTYTAVWTASSTLANNYYATMKVRVTANDNEAANNTAQAVSAAFTLDTAPPVVTATINASVSATTASTTIAVSDNSQARYRVCNDSTFPTTDAQGNVCVWNALGTYTSNTVSTWTPLRDAQGNEPVYIQAQDAYGNVATQTIVAPATPANFFIKDVSNIATQNYREFLSWSVFTATTSSAFSAYKVYSSTDGTTYTLLTTIADPALNYYRDDIVTATSSLHYYKAVVVTTQGNTSAYTNVLSDTPNGQGGTDVTPPVITPSSIIVPSSDLKNSSALITFTTDELSKGTVQYRVSGAGSWTTVNSLSYSLAHSVYVQGLTPNTTYNLQVQATDISGNVSAYVAGSDFATPGGPVISTVTTINLTDVSATITWNTSTSSDSYVYYSVNQDLSAATTKGSATQVACIGAVCQHKVDLTSLTPNTNYYYYVKSTDSSANISTDTNNGTYYSFTTTLDVTPPVITNISTPVISATAAVIVWQTDKPTNTQVAWGTASGALTRTTVLDSVKSAYHVVALSSQTNDTSGSAQALTALTPYFYKVTSVDAAGNSATSPEQTFTSVAVGETQIITMTQFIQSGGAGSGTTVAADVTTAPKITSSSADNIGAFSADIHVATDKNATTFVSYGDTTSYDAIEGDDQLSTAKVIKLTRLQEGTTYHYRVKAVDQYGNVTAGNDQTFKTLFVSEAFTNLTSLQKATDLQGKIEELIQSSLPSLAPPFITNPVVSSTTENSAVVTWRTNIKAIGSLRYAADAFYQDKKDYVTEVAEGQVMNTDHEVALVGLESNTLYHLQVRSYVFPQVVGASPDITFSTKSAPITVNVVSVKNSGFTVAWQTSSPTSSIVEYRNLKTGESNIVTDTAKKMYHDVQIQNLPSGVSYSVSVSGVSDNGNRIGSGDPITITTSVDVTAPVISNFKVDNALIPGNTGFVQTVVGWQTDKPANSTVYYERGSGAVASTTKELANKVELLDTYTTTHIMILPGLSAGTVYRIKVVTTDQSGNTKVFGPTSIITPNQTQSVLDIIVKNFEDTFKFLGAKQ